MRKGGREGRTEGREEKGEKALRQRERRTSHTCTLYVGKLAVVMYMYFYGLITASRNSWNRPSRDPLTSFI